MLYYKIVQEPLNFVSQNYKGKVMTKIIPKLVYCNMLQRTTHYASIASIYKVSWTEEEENWLKANEPEDQADTGGEEKLKTAWAPPGGGWGVWLKQKKAVVETDHPQELLQRFHRRGTRNHTFSANALPQEIQNRQPELALGRFTIRPCAANDADGTCADSQTRWPPIFR